jgi:acyl carrier protein
MTADEARGLIIGLMTEIAPDVDTSAIDASADLCDGIELDSMDFLNLITGISDSIGVEIPERDYPKLATLSGFISYLTASSLASQ